MTRWDEYPLEGTGGPGQITLRQSGDPATRRLTVALPPDYAEGDARYPVVYMHDGQNLFDPATSYAGDWGLVETLNRLAREGIAPIAVGIPNRGRQRRYEYSPFRDLRHGGGGGERYLAFLVDTVKPLIDTAFRTRPEAEHTVIAGSSLGGLISLYALYRHAGIFGAASVQSPALWFARRAIFRYLETETAEAGGGAGPRGRIHLDAGTEEGADTLEDARRLRDWLLTQGYRSGRELSYVEEAGGGHTEAAWGKRVRAALPFLLGIGDQGAGIGGADASRAP